MHRVTGGVHFGRSPRAARFPQSRWPAALVFILAVAATARASAAVPCNATPELEGVLLSDRSPEAYNAKGEYFLKGGDSECAIAAFRNALRLEADSWAPRFNLGLVHLRDGQLGEALAHLQIAADARPGELKARVALGSALAGLGRLERAADEFTAAIEMDPRSVDARQRLATTYLEQGRNVAAITQIKSALGIEPDSADSLLLLGTAHSKNGQPELAIDPLQRLVRMDPGHFAGRFNLATAYAQADRFSEASTHFAKALELEPSHTRARLSAAKALVNLKDFPRAIELTEPWAGAVPQSVDSFEVQYLRGIALREMGRLDEAEAALRDAIAERSGSAAARQALGELLAQGGRSNEAREHLQRARDLNPDSGQIRFALIAVLRELDDPDALQAELESFEERKRQIQREGLAERAAERASAYLSRGDAVAALREYEQGLSSNPLNANLHYGRALALSALGRHAERIESLGKAIELDPDLAAAHNEMGLALETLGRTAEAETALKAAIAADPQYAAAKGNLGVLYVARGRSAEAETLLRRAIEDDPASAHMHVNHAMALAALGRLEEAESAVQRARLIDPDDPKADRALELIRRIYESSPTDKRR